VVEKDYLHLFPGLIRRSRYHRRRKDLMGVQREMLRSLMNGFRLLAMWLSVDSAPVTTAESPRWKSAQMSMWAAEAGFSPSKRQFFLGFRLHLLVSNTGAICDFVLSPANVGERDVAEHMLAVEADWQAQQSSFCAEARPVLADDGRCWPTTDIVEIGSRVSLGKTVVPSGTRSGAARGLPLKAKSHCGLGIAACGLA
jgi:hypothetical protein